MAEAPRVADHRVDSQRAVHIEETTTTTTTTVSPINNSKHICCACSLRCATRLLDLFFAIVMEKESSGGGRVEGCLSSFIHAFLLAKLYSFGLS